MKARGKLPDKKAYASPNLFSYGDIRDVTRAIANNTKTADGGTGQTNKTA